VPGAGGLECYRLGLGGRGSNPRPADYEKYGPTQRARWLHRWHGVVPSMALIAPFARAARSTDRSMPDHGDHRMPATERCRRQGPDMPGLRQAGDVVDLDCLPFFIDRVEDVVPPGPQAPQIRRSVRERSGGRLYRANQPAAGLAGRCRPHPSKPASPGRPTRNTAETRGYWVGNGTQIRLFASATIRPAARRASFNANRCTDPPQPDQRGPKVHGIWGFQQVRFGPQCLPAQPRCKIC